MGGWGGGKRAYAGGEGAVALVAGGAFAGDFAVGVAGRGGVSGWGLGWMGGRWWWGGSLVRVGEEESRSGGCGCGLRS